MLSGQLSEEGPGEELSGEEMLSSFNEWDLPSREFDGMWERSVFYFCCMNLNCQFEFFNCIIKKNQFICSLIYESGLKQRLLRYAATALLFTERGVNPCVISWNR